MLFVLLLLLFNALPFGESSHVDYSLVSDRRTIVNDFVDNMSNYTGTIVEWFTARNYSSFIAWFKNYPNQCSHGDPWWDFIYFACSDGFWSSWPLVQKIVFCVFPVVVLFLCVVCFCCPYIQCCCPRRIHKKTVGDVRVGKKGAGVKTLSADGFERKYGKLNSLHPTGESPLTVVKSTLKCCFCCFCWGVCCPAPKDDNRFQMEESKEVDEKLYYVKGKGRLCEDLTFKNLQKHTKTKTPIWQHFLFCVNWNKVDKSSNFEVKRKEKPLHELGEGSIGSDEKWKDVIQLKRKTFKERVLKIFGLGDFVAYKGFRTWKPVKKAETALDVMSKVASTKTHKLIEGIKGFKEKPPLSKKEFIRYDALVSELMKIALGFEFGTSPVVANLIRTAREYLSPTSILPTDHFEEVVSKLLKIALLEPKKTPQLSQDFTWKDLLGDLDESIASDEGFEKKGRKESHFLQGEGVLKEDEKWKKLFSKKKGSNKGFTRSR